MPRRLAGATWPEAEHAGLVLVPVGSLEQHGPHLPLDTDTQIAEAVAHGVAELLDGAWVAPPVGYGASGEHQDFAGTSSIGTAALHLLLVELVRSIRTWASHVVLVNAHGGNVRTVSDVVTQLVHEGHAVTWVPCAPQSADSHAGYTETSLMLHLRPESVRLHLAAAGNTTPIEKLLRTLTANGVREVSPSGVLGDPSGANAEEGQRLLVSMVEHAQALLAKRRFP